MPPTFLADAGIPMLFVQWPLREIVHGNLYRPDKLNGLRADHEGNNANGPRTAFPLVHCAEEKHEAQADHAKHNTAAHV